MNAQEKAIAGRNATAKKTVAKKSAAKLPPKKASAKVADKRPNMKNVGQKCSVKGCTHDAKRGGLCSGKGSGNHYRKALRAERSA